MRKHPQMPFRAPRSDAVWARHGTREHRLQFILMTILCGTLAGFSSYVLVSGDFKPADSAFTIGVVVSVAGTLLTVAAVLALVTLPRRSHSQPAIAVDMNGVWWVHRRNATLTTWQDLAGVGTSYKIAPQPHAQSSAGEIRRAFAFEAYLRESVLDDHPHAQLLRAWLVTDEPPHPDLPKQRLRYFLPVSGVRKELQRMVTHYAPQLWLGEYERDWNPLTGS
ncbi:hypothetical protein [Stackebrandtia nassauensis]|nr:hypothetical protein [Stackebrandtia nassauensis]